ncbi:MAG: transposase [candidate division Zixibacteria bacterium]|nr:transposase [candidate division Zixibacteria bacterium]
MPILVDNADLLKAAIKKTRERLKFRVEAISVLPDHFHAVLELTESTSSDVVHGIKQSFMMQFNQRVGRRNGRVWQHRFWDHIIRDETDLRHHLDYIHYNPVKHGLAESPFVYKFSTARKFLEREQYAPDWGRIEFDDGNLDYGE